MANSTARFEKWFELILTMLDGRNHTARELAEVLGTTVRNLYYTFKVLGNMGFHIVHIHTYYYIDVRSPFLSRISQSVDFTEDEALYLHRMLDRDAGENAMAGTVRRKLERFYHLQFYDDARLRRQVCQNTELLEQAINERRLVILHRYSSPHSGSVADRVVEPFLFQGDRADIRAYELKSKQNKTFKIARIGRVEIVDTPWFNEEHHRESFTDMFMFSGEVRHTVRLRFGLLAHRLMLEEYPHSAALMVQEDDRHWLFQADVASYVGISRFILGLYDEIEVLEDDGLRAFLREKISRMR